MIVYESAAGPLVRAGEMGFAGRRVAARAIPYEREVGPPAWRFDPMERRFRESSSGGSVIAGPFDPEPWRRVFARAPAGSVLIGPCDAAEPVRGAYRAAAEGAALAGRGAYLLDPVPAGLPEDNPDAYVALFLMMPNDRRPKALESAVARGLSAGVLVPLVPGWTAEPEEMEAAIEAASRAGARFAAGLTPEQDGASRRSIVEARSELDPQAPEDFFEHVHHSDWSGAITAAERRWKEACARRGLATLPPRPIGPGEAAANAAAAARLEERAEVLSAGDEHRASLLHAAARWIDEFGRDLTPILKEGNFRKIFPFGEELARDAEEALARAVESP